MFNTKQGIIILLKSIVIIMLVSADTDDILNHAINLKATREVKSVTVNNGTIILEPSTNNQSTTTTKPEKNAQEPSP